MSELAGTAREPSPRWVLALTSAASFMVVLDTQVVTTALTQIRLSLGATLAALQWTVNAYTLTFAVLLMAGASLGDRFGRSRMFVTGIAIFIVASIGCALAPDIAWLIAARAVQGAGAALVMPLAMALLGASFPGARRARALGIFASVTGLAVFGGPIVGGAVAEGLSWHWIFWINLPIGLVLIALIRLRMRPAASDGPRSAQRWDVMGNVLAALAAFATVWGLVHGQSLGWTSEPVVLPLICGVVLVFLWIGCEARARDPMVPLEFFRSRAFSMGNAVSFLFNATLYGTLFFMAQFFQTAQGHGPLGAGSRLLPWTATLFLVAPLAGASIHRFGERSLVVAGLLLQAVGLTWIALVADPAVPFAQLVIPMVIAGAGVSMAMPATQNAVFGAVAPADIGKASGTYNMLRFLGGVVGVALTAAMFDRFGGFASPAAFSAGFGPALGLAAALSAAGAAAALGLPGRPSRVDAPAARAPSPSSTVGR
jgi:EmrB/QacA subfamily drug resistance transporter